MKRLAQRLDDCRRLLNRGPMDMAVSSTASVCGGEVAGSFRKTGVKPASMKQEASCVLVGQEGASLTERSDQVSG